MMSTYCALHMLSANMFVPSSYYGRKKTYPDGDNCCSQGKHQSAIKQGISAQSQQSNQQKVLPIGNGQGKSVNTLCLPCADTGAQSIMPKQTGYTQTELAKFKEPPFRIPQWKEDNVNRYVAQGKHHANAGRYTDALNAYNNAYALTFFPETKAVALIGKAYCALALGDQQLAIKYFSEAIEQDPDRGDHYFSRGVLYLNACQYESAALDFTAALEYSIMMGAPELVALDCYQNRGYANYQYGRYLEALDDFNHVLALDKKYIPAYQSLGYTYSALGNHEMASNYLTDYIRLAKAVNAKEYYHRGRSYERLESGCFPNKFQLAADDFYRAIEYEKKPSLIKAYACYSLGKLYERGLCGKNNIQHATMFYAQAFQYCCSHINESPRNMYFLAKMYQYGRGCTRDVGKAKDLYSQLAVMPAVIKDPLLLKAVQKRLDKLCAKHDLKSCLRLPGEVDKFPHPLPGHSFAVKLFDKCKAHQKFPTGLIPRP